MVILSKLCSKEGWWRGSGELSSQIVTPQAVIYTGEAIPVKHSYWMVIANINITYQTDLLGPNLASYSTICRLDDGTYLTKLYGHATVRRLFRAG